MAVRSVAFPGIVVAGSYFSGSGSGLSTATVPRAAIAAGTASHVVINDGGGALSSVAQLTVPLGGTGASTITGVVKGNAGAAMTGMTGTAGGVAYWSDSSTLGTSALGTSGQIMQSNGASAPTWVNPSTNISAGNGLTWGGTNTIAMVNPVTTAIGGTGANLINNVAAGVLELTGVAGARTVTVAQITDTEVSNSAAIARSKIAAGTASSVVLNDGSGNLSSSTQLAITLGGTGTSSAISGMVKGGTPMTGVTGTQYGAAYWSDANTIGSTVAGTAGYVLVANNASAPSWSSTSSAITVDSSLQWTLNTLGIKTPITIATGGTGTTSAIVGVVKGGASNLTGLTGTQYGVTYWSDSNTISSTLAGTAGYLLTANTNAAPTWSSPSSAITVNSTLKWTGSTLGINTLIPTTIGGTGTNLSSANTAGFVKMTGVAGSETMTVAQVLNSDIDNSAAIARSKIAVGTLNSVVINDGATGALSSTTQLSVGLGGTGASTLTGMVKGNAASALTAVTGTQYGVTYWSDANTIGSTVAGTAGYFLTANLNAAPSWTSPSAIVTVDSTLKWTGSTLGINTPVLTANGGTGANMSSASTTGFVKMTGAGGSETMTVATVVNTDIAANAAIDRSKIAVGTIDSVVINDHATGALSSTTQLSVGLGGTGASTLTGMVKGNAASALTAVTGTAYGAAYWSDANTLASTLAGTSGYVLTANGAGAPTWTSPSSIVTAGTGLTYSGSALGLVVPVVPANGGTGSTTLGSASTNGFVKMSGAAPNEVMVVASVVNTDIDASAAIARSKIAAGTVSQVVYNDGVSGLLTSEATLALSRGGTNAALTSDPTNKMILQFVPNATAVSTIIATNSSTASTVVVRDASGNAAFNDIQLNSSSGPTIAAPTTSSSVTATGNVSTSSGVTAMMIQITTAAGYTGCVRCMIAVGDAAASSNYGFFEATWYWKRTGGGGLEFNTSPTSKVVDKSNISSSYDISATTSSNNIRINAVQGVLATTLYWTGTFTIVHGALS